ncbi:uncharacterized protein BKCO1_400011 [Diplodia corticola]|uniref:Uncharacterized protein n=1 Tax=Diplodia corticola TaxID=236234 RepID=A0A1J9SGL9_9PEZI|nr:uncharacterized protein BKCO1_400011 [Diplodia corticola]OJD38725.1 hypothetical protein BKCO1_400011 [Diplodia corticola]
MPSRTSSGQSLISHLSLTEAIYIPGSGHGSDDPAEGEEGCDFYAHNRPPTPCTPELFPTPPRERMERLAREQQAAADAASAEELRRRLRIEKQKRGDTDDDDNAHLHTASARNVTQQKQQKQSEGESSQDSSYDIVPDDEVEAARREEQEAQDAAYDDAYRRRVTDQSIRGFGVHAVQEGIKGLKTCAEPLAKRIEGSRWLKKPVGTPEELKCPCWGYPGVGWRFCLIHQGEYEAEFAAAAAASAAAAAAERCGGGEGDEGVVWDEDEVDDDEDEVDDDEDEVDDDEDGGVLV